MTENQVSDLLNRAQAGDEGAFVDLLKLSTPQLRRSIHSLGIPDDTRSVLSEGDVLQETYVDAFLHFSEFRESDGASFASWLRQIARSNLSDAIRELKAAKRGGEYRRKMMTSLQESWMSLTNLVAARMMSPSGEVKQQELVDAVRRAVESLPDESRHLITWYDLEQLSPADTAEHCGCSLGAMFMRRRRAFEKLAERLRSWQPD